MKSPDTDPKRVWRWAFGGANDPEIKYLMLGRYCDQLSRIDERAALYLQLYLGQNLPAPKVYRPGKQIQLFTDFGTMTKARSNGQK